MTKWPRRAFIWLVVGLITGWAVTKLQQDISTGSGPAILGDCFAIICVLGLGFNFHLEEKIGQLNEHRADLNRQRAEAAEAAFLDISTRLLTRLENEIDRLREPPA